VGPRASLDVCKISRPQHDSIAGTSSPSGDRISVGARYFTHVQTGPGVHPSSCTMGTRSFPEVKRPGRGADHPPPYSAEVTKGLGQLRPVTGLLYLYLFTVQPVASRYTD
jgi:hypothetical protein